MEEEKKNSQPGCLPSCLPPRLSVRHLKESERDRPLFIVRGILFSHLVLKHFTKFHRTQGKFTSLGLIAT